MNLLKEPLVVFVVIAALIFAADRMVGGGDDREPIEVTDAVRATIVAQWEAQMGRPPSASELEGLVGQWIKEEIYAREAERLGLDENDIIIRRRLVQKLTFLTEDVATSVPPGEATLRDYYQANIDRYKAPATWSFSHRYFSNESRSAAEADARRALAQPDLDDDPFMLQKSYSRQTRQQIAALFGTDFSNSLVELEPGNWQGPVLSAYGWHIVRVEAHEAMTQRPFKNVTAAVERDYLMQQRADANEAFFETLKTRYEVVQ